MSFRKTLRLAITLLESAQVCIRSVRHDRWSLACGLSTTLRCELAARLEINQNRYIREAQDFLLGSL